jgi:hypothetical protein
MLHERSALPCLLCIDVVDSMPSSALDAVLEDARPLCGTASVCVLVIAFISPMKWAIRSVK